MNTRLIEKILFNMSILYVESDSRYQTNVSEALNMKCKNVFVSSCVEESLDIFNNNNINIVITDINIKEEEDGTKLIKKIREINKDTPIIIISASKDAMQIVQLIGLGLVDYIFKPISLRRLRNDLYKSVQIILDKGIYIIFFENDITYNVTKRLLSKNENEITLTNSERMLLDYFVLNKNTILTKDEIKREVWEFSYDITDSAFKSLINRLRNKIGKNTIKNISGSGYILNV